MGRTLVPVVEGLVAEGVSGASEPRVCVAVVVLVAGGDVTTQSFPLTVHVLDTDHPDEEAQFELPMVVYAGYAMLVVAVSISKQPLYSADCSINRYLAVAPELLSSLWRLDAEGVEPERI